MIATPSPVEQAHADVEGGDICLNEKKHLTGAALSDMRLIVAFQKARRRAKSAWRHRSMPSFRRGSGDAQRYVLNII